MPERLDRLNRLKAALPGLLIDSQLEPSHSLVDQFVGMAEDQGMSFVDLIRCTSREAELNHVKRELSLDFALDGTSKLTRKARELKAEVVSDRDLHWLCRWLGLLLIVQLKHSLSSLLAQ